MKKFQLMGCGDLNLCQSLKKRNCNARNNNNNKNSHFLFGDDGCAEIVSGMKAKHNIPASFQLVFVLRTESSVERMPRTPF